MDTVPLKLHCGNTGAVATGMTLAGRDLEETCLSSLESDVMSPKKVFFGEWIHGAGDIYSTLAK